MIGPSPRTTHGSPPLDDPQPTAPRADPEATPDLAPGSPRPLESPPPPERGAGEPARGADEPRATEPAPKVSAPAGAPPPPAPENPGTGEDAPSLRHQIGATRTAAKRLVTAHVDLAKAEIGDVLDEVKKVAALGGIAVGAGIAAGLLLAVGLPLFLGELIFGSMGWGLLHGLLLLAGIGTAAIVIALGVGSGAVGRATVIGIATAVVIGVVLGLNLTNRAWGAAGDALLPLADPGARALAAALVLLPIVFAVLIGLLSLMRALGEGASGAGSPGLGSRIPAAAPTALYVGWLAAFAYSYSSRVAWPDLSLLGVGVAGFVIALVVLIVVASWRPGMALITGMGIGTMIGIPLAGLTALAIGGRVAAAIGVTIGLSAWIGMMGAELATRGVDGEELKKRFIPQKTIDITKETIEWARARMPLSRRS